MVFNKEARKRGAGDVENCKRDEVGSEARAINEKHDREMQKLYEKKKRKR